MSANTFTQEQLFSGLWIFLREDYGCESRFDPDSRLDDYFLAERIWDELDTGELASELSKFFGFSCSLEEWENFFGWSANARDVDGWELMFAPHFTFRGLADFIRERLEVIPLEPLCLLGKPCLTAGIFRGLERIALQVNPRVKRFAPSTPIHERLAVQRAFWLMLLPQVFAGKALVCIFRKNQRAMSECQDYYFNPFAQKALRRKPTIKRRAVLLGGWHRHALWTRLRWITEERIPESPIIRIQAWCFRRSIILRLAIGIIIAIWHYGLSGLVIGLGAGLLTTFILMFPLGLIVGCINLLINPLPKEIKTFGDLARYLAVITDDQQTEAASCSTP